MGKSEDDKLGNVSKLIRTLCEVHPSPRREAVSKAARLSSW